MGTEAKPRQSPGPKPHADGGYVIVPVNVRAKMRDEIDAAADAAGMSRSAWLRQIITRSLARRR